MRTHKIRSGWILKVKVHTLCMLPQSTFYTLDWISIYCQISNTTKVDNHEESATSCQLVPGTSDLNGSKMGTRNKMNGKVFQQKHNNYFQNNVDSKEIFECICGFSKVFFKIFRTCVFFTMMSWLFLKISNLITWQELINQFDSSSDGQQFHQYQQNKQSPLTSYNWTQNIPWHIAM
jgi:hypothetical protein